MSDLHLILPSFPTEPYAHVLAALARAHVATADLAALSGGAGSAAAASSAIARRARLPAAEVVRLANAVVAALLRGGGEAEGGGGGGVASPAPLPRQWRCVSTLDARLDLALGGGFPAGYVTEITGESGAGKTQLLLTLLLACQLAPPHGLSRPALYLSTEAGLPTARLASLAASHPLLAAAPASPSAQQPSLSRVHAIRAADLEAQEHIVRFQLPEAARRYGAGLVVVDSVAAHFRAELGDERGGSGSGDRNGAGGGGGGGAIGPAAALAERRARLVALGAQLRQLARETGAAVVVSNQVADRFSFDSATATTTAISSSISASASASTGAGPAQTDPLALDHQQRWFTGWGDVPPQAAAGGDKTPTLGLAWTNQIAGRVALILEAADEGPGPRRRWMRVVFARWAPQTEGRGVEYRITAGGVESVDGETESGEAVKS